MAKKAASKQAISQTAPVDDEPYDLREVVLLLGEVLDELKSLNKTLAAMESRDQTRDLETPLSDISSHCETLVKTIQKRSESGF